mmetsp:Transcript_24252/g.58581  ORF Transcript_24252/g.58581 Transcript_24252/m.58581 type:complete len:264 (-) Transcript_24252:4-795(-)
MGEETPSIDAAASPKKRKAESTPPDGYVCRLCSVAGHWIQVCPMKKTGTKRQRKPSDHVPVPGKDPSLEDIERARELQKIPPPKCFCGVPSRLNRVKRSKEGGDTSRAIGKYFFFCSKKRDDETQCRFARPVEMELNKKKGVVGGKQAKGKIGEVRKDKRSDKKKEDTTKPKPICKFFAKNGSCKKGKNCEFSHGVQAKEEPKRAKEICLKVKMSESENENDDSSDYSSSSSSDDDSNDNKVVKGGDKGGVTSDSDDSSSSDE